VGMVFAVTFGIITNPIMSLRVSFFGGDPFECGQHHWLTVWNFRLRPAFDHLIWPFQKFILRDSNAS
jgi:hypothetical protein